MNQDNAGLPDKSTSPGKEAETLFKVLFAERDGYLEIRALDGDIVKERRFFKLPGGAEAAARYCSGFERDVLFGVQPRVREGGKNQDISVIVALYVDYDGDGLPFRDFTLQPTAITASGGPGHHHGYWVLAEPLTPKEGSAYLKALAVALGGDVQVTDPARCLRVPRTINTKRRTYCKLMAVDSNRRYGVKQMRHAITVALLGPFWTEGQRQSLALSLAGFLAKQGVSVQEAEELVGDITTYTRDEQTRGRLRALMDTYKKLAEGRSVTGYRSLKELLPIAELEALTGLWGMLVEHAPHAIPVIRVNGRYMREITNESLNALQTANEARPQIFTRGGALVRLHRDEHGLAAQPLTTPALKGELDRIADFVVQKDDKEKPARPPDDVVADIQSLRQLPFLELRGIALSPVVVAEGRLISTQGYDRPSGIYLDLNGVNVAREMMPLREAVLLMNQELLGDFPFADDASLAHSIALIIQPFVRYLIDGPTPLYLIDAPSQGTGKGLVTEVTAEVATGQAAAIIAQPRNEEETRKRITALLLGGHPLIVLDNVYELRSAALCAVLTSRVWEDRILGRSQTVRLRNISTWIATGNNVELSLEMARRVVPIRLDAGVERPEERRYFRHPGLLIWVRANRSQLVTAALSIIQAWVDAGMPAGTGTMGRFEEWVRVMGGILGVAGINGFLGNRKKLYEVSDRESREWSAFCALWWQTFGTRPVTAGDLFDLVKERRFLLDILAGRSALAAQQRLGHALAHRRERIFRNWRINLAGRSSETGSVSYRLEEVNPQAAITPQTTENTLDEAEAEPEVSGISGDYSPQGGRQQGVSVDVLEV